MFLAFLTSRLPVLDLLLMKCLVCHGHNTLWLFVIWMLSKPDLHHDAATKTKHLHFCCSLTVKNPVSEIKRVRTVFCCRECKGDLVTELRMTRCMCIITTRLASEIAGLSTISEKKKLCIRYVTFKRGRNLWKYRLQLPIWHVKDISPVPAFSSKHSLSASSIQNQLNKWCFFVSKKNCLLLRNLNPYTVNRCWFHKPTESRNGQPNFPLFGLKNDCL